MSDTSQTNETSTQRIRPALPNDRCENYLHMVDVTYNLENRAYGLYQYYYGLGDYQTAESYRQEWIIWSDEFNYWTDKYNNAGC
jgi:hypothetical protein